MNLRQRITGRRQALIGLGAAAVLIAAVACTNGDGDEPAVSDTASPAGNVTEIVTPLSDSPEIPISEVIARAKAGGRVQIEVSGDTVTLTDGEQTFRSRKETNSSLIEMLEEAGVDTGQVAITIKGSSGSTNILKELPPAVGAGSSGPVVAIGEPAPALGVPVPVRSPQEFAEGFQPAVSVGRVGSSLGNGQQVGIWVNGMGQVLVEPDVATLYIGVESREATVSEARQAAADAMQRVFDAVQAEGVAEDDIVTTSFNVYPQQIWKEVRQASGSYSAPEIIGYVVSNTVQIKIRDLDTVGTVVDAAAEEAGDLVRINNIQFGIDNPSQYAQQLRRLAAEDAWAKAQVYADALGVTLGPIVYLTETGSSAPMIVAVESAAFDLAAASRAPTPIMSGDASLSSSIQAVFAILSG